MKAFQTMVVVVLTMTALSTCTEDEIKIAPPGMLTATYGGKSFESAEAVGHFDDYKFLLGGFAEDNSHLSMSIDNAQPGTYSISDNDPEDQHNAIVYMPKDYDGEQTVGIYSSRHIYDGRVGSIIVTELDEENLTISGTFRSRIKRSVPKEEEVQIEGSFTKVPYTPAPLPRTFSANINGTAFTPWLLQAMASSDIVMINAFGLSESITLFVPQSTPTGTFSLDDGLEGAYHAIVTQDTQSFVSVSGNIIINKHDKAARRIEGTFSFVAEDPVSGGSQLSVNSGEFAVSY